MPDAYHLPPEPGSGYLKVDTTVFERFKAALVSGAVPAAERRHPRRRFRWSPTSPSTAWAPGSPPAGAADAETDDAESPAAGCGERSVLDVLVRPAWPPPARPRSARSGSTRCPGAAAGPLVTTDDHARARHGAPRSLGTGRRPGASSAQFPLEWDFTGGGGNLVVAGAPQSGKSDAARARMISSLSLRYAPGDVAFYCLDYGGGIAARRWRTLPHVAAVATRVDPERISRTVNDVLSVLDSREAAVPAARRSTPWPRFRRARAAGQLPADVPGDIFLVVDGWGTLPRRVRRLELHRRRRRRPRARTTACTWSLTVTQTMQVRMRMQSAFGGRLELRLNDPFDSQFDRKVMQQIPKETPGRGLIESGCSSSRPRCQGSTAVERRRRPESGAAARWSRCVTSAGRGGVAEVRGAAHPVPARASCPRSSRGEAEFRSGFPSATCGPAGVDLFGVRPAPAGVRRRRDRQDQPAEADRSGHMELQPRPTELGIVVVDYRRTLLDVVPEEYLLAYCTSSSRRGGGPGDRRGRCASGSPART